MSNLGKQSAPHRIPARRRTRVDRTTVKDAGAERAQAGTLVSQVERRRGLAARVIIGSAKTVVRPYVEAGKSVKRLRVAVRNLGRAMAGGGPAPEELYIQAPDAKSAFESLYRRNGWTEAQLATQRIAVVRAKFVALVLAIAFLAVSLFGLLTIGYLAYLPVAAIFIGLCVAAMGLSLFIHHAISQAQIDERRLFTAREFFAHRDRWMFLFSS